MKAFNVEIGAIDIGEWAKSNCLPIEKMSTDGHFFVALIAQLHCLKHGRALPYDQAALLAIGNSLFAGNK